MPYDMCDDIEPIYEELPGWKEDITKCTKLEELPKELLDYIKYLEEKTQVKIKYLSLGPDREQTIELSVKSL
jgi:adenylosuccinate synthase